MVAFLKMKLLAAHGPGPLHFLSNPGFCGSRTLISSGRSTGDPITRILLGGFVDVGHASSTGRVGAP